MDSKLINIENHNGILTVSSREIAENFDKRHDKLTSEIERKYGEYIVDENECPRYGGNLLFIRSTYIHPQNNQEYKQYLLTRDGFSLLVMGFTGTQYLQWKLDYIKAFNNMENYINSSQTNLVALDDKQKIQLEFLNCTPTKAVILHKQLIEIAKNEAIKEERNGNDKVTNLSTIVKEVNIDGLTTTIFNEWLCEQGFGEMVEYAGNKKRRVFTPNDSFFNVLASEGYILTGKTLKSNVRIIYTTRMIEYVKENMQSLKEYVEKRIK